MNHHKPSKGFDSRTREELVEISRKAGISSGKARRKIRRRLDREKLQQRARQEIIHKEVLAIRHAAKEMLAATITLKQEHQ